MTHYFITGTSSGIGKALTELLLKDPNNSVIGFSRREIVKHPNYQHVYLDLANIELVRQYEFPELKKADKIVLVNNAGYIGDIKRQGFASSRAIIDTYTINLIAPALLMNSFLKAYSDHPPQKIILNVSSGAGKRAIDAWGPYCSTKAGIDLLSATIEEEQNILANDSIRIFSIAPGVVDTEMQQAIRSSNKDDFSNHDNFVAMKENNELSSSEEVAEKYKRIIDNPAKYTSSIFSLRDIN